MPHGIKTKNRVINVTPSVTLALALHICDVEFDIEFE